MESNRPHWADTAIAIFTGLMLVTYITGNYFSCRQLKLTKRTITQTEKSLNATVEQFNLDQRAWIGVDEFHTVAFSKTVGLIADIKFVNTGKTPARDVSQAVRYITSPTAVSGPTSEQINALPFTPAQSVAPQGHYILHVGYATGARASNLPSQMTGLQDIVSQFPLIRDQKLFLYYYGTIKYKDISSRDHNTNFCIYLANPKTGDLGYCDGFNDLN